MTAKSGFTFDFNKPILRKMQADMDALVKNLANHIDEHVIEEKFKRGFPGHQLQPTTIRRKGHDRVGEDTGKLQKAASSWVNWTIRTSSVGSRTRVLEKDKRRLTTYGFVATKIGGSLDFLDIAPEDTANIQGFIRSFLRAGRYKGSGAIKVIKK